MGRRALPDRPVLCLRRGTLVAMRVGRLGLLAPVLLVALVGALGTLQYRWLGKVSEAEREEMRRSLEQRAREFADDFDAEISRAYIGLQPPHPAVVAGDWSGLAPAFDRWRGAARFPGLIRGIYLTEEDGDRRTLRRYDVGARAFGPPSESWPPHLEAVRARIAGQRMPPLPQPERAPQIVAISITPVVPEAPAILIGLPHVTAPAAVPGERGRGTPSRASEHQPGRASLLSRWLGSYLVLDLDAEYLRATVLPELVARHFPDQGPEGYRVAILSAAGAPLFVRGVAPGTAIDPAHADVVTELFRLRMDVVRDLALGPANVTFSATAEPPATEAKGAPPDEGKRVAVFLQHRGEGSLVQGVEGAGGRVRLRQTGWRLVLRHPSGSLGAAVMEARRRNLWLGFGILAVLAAGVVLVVGNARRAKQLAANQMDFVATVSHELRTPLTVIRSAGQNLAAGVVLDPVQARRYGELIENEGARLTEMVEQVLEYARLRGDRPLRDPRPVDVGLLIDEVAASSAAACTEAGVTLDVDVPPEGLPPVAGEASALRRALGNLVSNALRHAAEGRWVRMEAGVETSRGRTQVRVAVSDRGPGIDAADLAHVFEPFYRGRRAVEHQVHGNGLGLSLVKRVVEAHGGSIGVRSAAGEGSTFTIHLPAAPAITVGAPLRHSASQSDSPA